MPALRIALNILLIIVSIVLIAVILMQDAKTAGLGSAFGNDITALGRSRSAKASKEAKLRKLTIILGAAVGVIALILLIIG